MPAAIPIAIAAASAASAGGAIYAANKQASAGTAAAKLTTDASTASTKAQIDAANHAADLQAQAAKDALDYTKQQAAQTQANFNTAQRGNYDQWASREGRLGTLGSMVGLGARDIPAYVQPQDLSMTAPVGAPSGTLGAMASGSASSSSPSAFIKGLLDQGMNPQQAVAQTNSQFKLGTGSEAVYYDTSQHGGVATIGLPDSYLESSTGKWNIVPRSGGGAVSAAPVASAPSAAKAPGTLGAPLYASPPITGNLALPQPGTLAAYLQGIR